jgi:putative hydroxymethylpyrimidine transporter CytX
MAAILDQLHDEAVGIEPLPEARRVLGAWDSFVLWADLGISFLVMVVGTFLVPGLGLGAALLAILVGALIGNVLLGLAAIIGAQVGMPTMALLRNGLGIRGSYVPTVLNILQLLGWATFEAVVVAQAADVVVGRLFGIADTYHWWVIVFSLVTLALALGGPVLVTRQWLEKFAFWAVLVSTVWVTVTLITSVNFGELMAQPGTGDLTFWAGVDLVVALPISWFPLVADYSRFARSKKAAFWGTGLGYFAAQVWFYTLGVLLVLAAGAASDPDAPIAPLVAAIAGLTAGWAALVILMVDETKEGFANVYSTAVSIQNLVPRASQRTLIVAICVVMFVGAWVLPLAEYESFLLLIGSAFVPLLGVLAADFFVLHGGRYDPHQVLRGRDSAGVRWPFLIVWLVGVALYITIAGVPAVGLNGVAPWLGASIPSFLIAFVLTVAVGRLMEVRTVPEAARL